jgi:hypothetical protein
MRFAWATPCAVLRRGCAERETKPGEVTAMQQFFDQLLQFLQQGISAIFRFVQLIWTWTVDQIGTLVQVPWQDWPLWKQIVVLIVIGGVAWALFKAAKELWEAG